MLGDYILGEHWCKYLTILRTFINSYLIIIGLWQQQF